MADELFITRTFNAPRELVWKYWIESERFKEWWGPKGFTTPVCEIDLRVGGRLFYGMKSPEGQIFYGSGVYREIVPPKRLVVTDSFADENGKVVPASNYGMSKDIPLELVVTYSFQEEQGKTKFTLRHSGFPPGPDFDNARAGWNESLDKLDAMLKQAARR